MCDSTGRGAVSIAFIETMEEVDAKYAIGGEDNSRGGRLNRGIINVGTSSL
jgi:hypothetical protein